VRRLLLPLGWLLATVACTLVALAAVRLAADRVAERPATRSVESTERVPAAARLRLPAVTGSGSAATAATLGPGGTRTGPDRQGGRSGPVRTPPAAEPDRRPPGAVRTSRPAQPTARPGAARPGSTRGGSSSGRGTPAPRPGGSVAPPRARVVPTVRSTPRPTVDRVTTAPLPRATPSPTPTPTVRPSPRPTESSPPAPAQTVTRRLAAGTVSVRFAGGSVSLVSAVPAPGFALEVKDAGPERVEVEFRSEDRQSKVRAEYEDGVPSVRVEEDQ
jgi:hypothetical protein